MYLKKTITGGFLFLGVILFVFPAIAQEPRTLHNPKIDLSLSPVHNRNISPEFNPGINPKTNWNINPAYNKVINPAENNRINPKTNADLNPMNNHLLNPMFYKNLNPKNVSWRGLYLYDEKDNLIGYITMPMRNVFICFDIKSEWTCYYVLTPEGTYNHFEKNGDWTGNYLCSDSNGGYNVFTKEGNWTGNHVK